MRNLSVLVLAMPLLAAALPAEAGCLEAAGCGMPDLRLSSALVGEPPLVWSSSLGGLEAIEAGTSGGALRRTISLSEIVGLRIAPVGESLQAVTYNSPDRPPGASDPGVVVVPLLRPRHPARYRGAYP